MSAAVPRRVTCLLYTQLGYIPYLTWPMAEKYLKDIPRRLLVPLGSV